MCAYIDIVCKELKDKPIALNNEFLHFLDILVFIIYQLPIMYVCAFIIQMMCT